MKLKFVGIAIICMSLIDFGTALAILDGPVRIILYASGAFTFLLGIFLYLRGLQQSS
jgi:hypothetical protein